MADKTGYVGRNPNDSAVVLARQFFTASGVTTTFTFASGYLTGYLDVYVDGVKRRVADEFTATDGATFDVLQGGVSAGSTVEAVAYKAFNAAATVGDVTGNFNVSGNTTLDGSLSVTGGTTLSNINVTGIATLGAGTTVAFANTAFNLSGTPDITIASLSAVDINVSGAATIGGILTYEDVTNIDSVGIVTARTGVEVTANGLVVNAGVSTFAADVSIADKIVHTGDTNTAIRFPSADTITAETAGVERLRIDSTGDVGLVGIATATGLVVVAGSGVYAGHTGVVTAVTFDGNVSGNISGGTVAGSTGTFTSDVDIADKIVHTGDTNTAIRFPAADTFTVETAGTEALRVDSSQRLLLGTTTEGHVSADDITVAGSGDVGITIRSGTGSEGSIMFSDGTSGDDEYRGWINYNQSSNFLRFFTNATEALRVDSSQRLLIGLTAAATAVPPSESNASLLQVGATNNPVSIGLVRSDTSISSGNIFGGVHWYGTDTTSNTPTIHASIQAAADGDHAAGDNPSRLTFSTTSDSASSVTERLRITSAGEVIVNGTAAGSNAKFEVQSTTGSISSATLRLTAEKTTTGAINTGSTIILAGHDGGNSRDFASLFAGKENGTGSNHDAYLAFGTRENGSALAERVHITSTGRLLVGTTSSVDSSNENLAIVSGGNTQLTLARNDTSVGDGHTLAQIKVYGNDSNGTYQECARIGFEADGAHATDDKPTRMVFETTADGASSPTERARITSTGQFNVGSGSFVVESDGDISTNVRCHGHIELDSTGNFSSIKVKLYSNTGNAEFAGTVEDSIGPLRRLGQEIKSGNYTLVAGDAGKHIRVDGNHTITVPDNVFTAGDMVTIVANSSSAVPITQGSNVSLYNATDGTTGNKTLAARTVCTLLVAEGGTGAKIYIAGGGIS